jgi:hypothetical protein
VIPLFEKEGLGEIFRVLASKKNSSQSLFVNGITW